MMGHLPTPDRAGHAPRVAGAPGPRLALRLMGPPRLDVGDQPVRFDNRKTLALLAFLAVEGHAQMRDTLTAMLWPEADRAHARGALRRVLASLKAAVGPGWLEVAQESVGLARRADGRWVDVERFRRGLATCRDHNHSQARLCPGGRDAVAEALALYRGDFLAGFTLRDSPEFDHWQLAHSEGLRFSALRGLERLVRFHSTHGPWEEAVAHARRWLFLDPLCEAAHRSLMQLYAWSGERGMAVRQYEQCVEVLAGELGTRPQVETVRLAEAIRDGRLHGPAPAPAWRQEPEPWDLPGHERPGRQATDGGLTTRRRPSHERTRPAASVPAPDRR
jgi:DNA-binding SARP family transcriptional activator